MRGTRLSGMSGVSSVSGSGETSRTQGSSTLRDSRTHGSSTLRDSRTLRSRTLRRGSRDHFLTYTSAANSWRWRLSRLLRPQLNVRI
jgi:hypothetical protein